MAYTEILGLYFREGASSHIAPVYTQRCMRKRRKGEGKLVGVAPPPPLSILQIQRERLAYKGRPRRPFPFPIRFHIPCCLREESQWGRERSYYPPG